MNAQVTATNTKEKEKITLENGIYIKAKICGAIVREVKGKKNPNEVYKFYTLIMETSLTSQKTYINLRGKAIENGYHDKFNSPQYVGKTCMIPVMFALNRYDKDGRQMSNMEITYFGEEKPVFFDV